MTNNTVIPNKVFIEAFLGALFQGRLTAAWTVDDVRMRLKGVGWMVGNLSMPKMPWRPVQVVHFSRVVQAKRCSWLHARHLRASAFGFIYIPYRSLREAPLPAPCAMCMGSVSWP